MISYPVSISHKINLPILHWCLRLCSWLIEGIESYRERSSVTWDDPRSFRDLMTWAVATRPGTVPIPLLKIWPGSIYHCWIATIPHSITCSVTNLPTALTRSTVCKMTTTMTLSCRMSCRKMTAKWHVTPWPNRTVHLLGRVTAAALETAHFRVISETPRTRETPPLTPEPILR